MPRISPDAAGGKNVCAFLDVLGVSELAAMLTMPQTDDGYRILVGSMPSKLALFSSYACHPLPNPPGVQYRPGAWSTAAGRYQILSKYWPFYQRSLKLPDFGPLSQDLYAIQQLRERHALSDIIAGRFDIAIAKCNTIWASLPGSPYGQHTNPIDPLRLAFGRAGGVLA